MNTLIVVKSPADAILAKDIASAVETHTLVNGHYAKKYELSFLVRNQVILKGLRDTIATTTDAYYRKLNPTLQRKVRGTFARIITISA